MRYVHCAWGFSYKPWRKNRSGSFQKALPLPLSAAGDGYRWTSWSRWRQSRQVHSGLWYPPYVNRSGRIPDSRSQSPFSQQSWDPGHSPCPYFRQTAPGRKPGFPLSPWNQAASLWKAHNPDLPDPERTPASTGWPFFPPW